MAKPTVTVEARQVFGGFMIYPVDANAVLFTLLTGKKTLSVRELTTIEGLGFEVVEHHTKNLKMLRDAEIGGKS